MATLSFMFFLNPPLLMIQLTRVLAGPPPYHPYPHVCQSPLRQKSCGKGQFSENLHTPS